MNGRNWRNLRGMSLIEVLVALLVLGIAVMGFAALQLNAVRISEDTYSRSQAMAIAQNLIERMRANVDATSTTYVSSDLWSADPGSSTACFTADDPSPDDICESTAMAAQDIKEVQRMARDSLPHGSVLAASCGSVTCITVAWDKATTATCDQEAIDSDAGDRAEEASCVVVEFIP